MGDTKQGYGKPIEVLESENKALRREVADLCHELETIKKENGKAIITIKNLSLTINTTGE